MKIKLFIIYIFVIKLKIFQHNTILNNYININGSKFLYITEFIYSHVTYTIIDNTLPKT